MADVFELMQEFFNFETQEPVDVDMEDILQAPLDPALVRNIPVIPGYLGASSVAGQHSSIDGITEEIVTPALSCLVPKGHMPIQTTSAAQKKPR